MSSPSTEEIDRIRRQYDAAIDEACLIFQDVEYIAAYLILERDRLKSLPRTDDDHELSRAIEENEKLLAQSKEKMRFLLDKIHDLVVEKRHHTADILASEVISDLGNRLPDFVEWVGALSEEIGKHVTDIKLDAKVESEISDVRLEGLRKTQE